MTDTRPHISAALYAALMRKPGTIIRRQPVVEAIKAGLFEARIVSMRTEDPEVDAAADHHAGPFVPLRLGMLSCPTGGREEPVIIPEVSIYHHYTRVCVGERPGEVNLRFETIRRDYKGRQPRLELVLRVAGS